MIVAIVHPTIGGAIGDRASYMVCAEVGRIFEEFLKEDINRITVATDFGESVEISDIVMLNFVELDSEAYIIDFLRMILDIIKLVILVVSLRNFFIVANI